MCAVPLTTEKVTEAGGVLVNDFAITAATVNGSGSQTANNTLVRALFKMGIPVNGKNLFPSNIYGLPTWYTIRLSKDGYIARRPDYHVLATLNPKTQAEDIEKLASGGLVVHPEEWKLKPTRDDITYIPMPVREMVKESGANPAIKDYVANMVYVGAIAELIGIDLAEIKNALVYFLKGKAKAVDLNFGLVEKAAARVRENFADVPRRFRAERMDATKGKVMLEGNAAAALGAIFGGVSVAAWYPITPSTSVIDNLMDYAKELRVDPETGKTTLAIVQAEDELAAAGMIIGAGWMGARSMTATSGPGISLMAEFSGLAYFAEVPCVIWDIQRVGPSTGLPTRTSQGDVLKTYYLSHGDTRHVVLLPNGMQECFEFGWRAHDLADHLQTPVFVLSDLDLGMNLWMTDPLEYPDQPMDRGKVVTYESLEQFGTWGRYKDVDGDGIAYRSLPGQGPAYFARGTGHTEFATYSEKPEDWSKNLARLAKKHDTARRLVPQPITDLVDGAKFGIISYGSVDPAIVEARDLLAADGVKTSYHRLRALPLGESTREFLGLYDRIYVVENNDLGQMAMLLRMEYPEFATKMVAVHHLDGLPTTAQWVVEHITTHESERK
ncbi:MAG: 2-oxoacid:acceptor oxidoreductase subunit alpha [Anaerolineae bacterium]